MSATTTTHDAVSFLNRSGQGIRTYVACTCGWSPKKMPTAGSTMHVAYMAHLRAVGMPRPQFLATVYGEGPAIGLTFDQWYQQFPNCDPYGARPCDVVDCGHVN